MKIDQTKRPGQFRFISLGDVHLGHPQTPTALIIENLDRYCTNDAVLRDVDLLVITGDLFDRLLHNADENVHLINRWITHLLFRCSYLNVALRVVEGTPSHDRGQSRFIVEQARNANIDIDLHYATELSIEYIERFGIHVLYIPDKWRTTTTETLEEVRLLMKEKGLEQVDFAIMHGAFEYQLPSIVKEPTHDSETYLQLVKHFILIGHVHLATQHERILAAGSYDRICHGEEGPKGYYDVTLFADGNAKITFVENKGAKKYVTVACHGLDTKAANFKIREALKDLPKGSALRVRCNTHDVVAGDLDTFRREWPHYEWTITVDSEDRKKKEERLDKLLTMDLNEFIPIDASSIVLLVGDELEKREIPSPTRANCLRRLQELLESR